MQMMSSLYPPLVPYNIFLSISWVYLVCPDTHPSPLLLLVPNPYITPHLSPHLSPQPLYSYLLPSYLPPTFPCGVINQHPYQPTYPQNNPFTFCNMGWPSGGRQIHCYWIGSGDDHGECNIPSGCMTSCGTCKSGKPHTCGKQVEVFVIVLIHYICLTLWEWKLRCSLNFRFLIWSGRRSNLKRMI